MVRLGRFEPKGWKNLKQLNQLWYVFIDGVVLSGWPIALSYVLYEYFRDQYLGHTPATFNVSDLIDNLVIFSIAGIVMGFRSWERDERHSQKLSA